MIQWKTDKYSSVLYWGCILGLCNLIIALYLYLYSSQESMLDSYIWAFFQLMNLTPMAVLYYIFKIFFHINLIKYTWSLLLLSFLWPFLLFVIIYLILNLWYQVTHR